MGTDDFIFIEDNIFDTNGAVNVSHFIMASYGGRMVVRYNTMRETTGYSAVWIDSHGYCHGSFDRGTRAFEIYGNNFIRGYNGCCRGLFLRGGTGVIFDNIFNESIGKFWWQNIRTSIQFVEYRSSMWLGTKETCSATCSTSGWCASQSENPTRYCINDDANYSSYNRISCTDDSVCGPGGKCSSYGEGYPCCDQIGVGKNQISEPVYMWNNNDHLGQKVIINTHSSSTLHIVENRDYFPNTTKSDYIAYAYPHPLTIEMDTIPPSSPQNLSIY